MRAQHLDDGGGGPSPLPLLLHPPTHPGTEAALLLPSHYTASSDLPKLSLPLIVFVFVFVSVYLILTLSPILPSLSTTEHKVFAGKYERILFKGNRSENVSLGI